jgi:hypothetical protein
LPGSNEFVYLFSEQILWILGKNYSELQFELVLSIIGAGMGLIIGVAFNLYASKGWILSPFFTILFNILPTIAGCLIFDLTALDGVLYLNILIAAVLMFVHIGFGMYKIRDSQNNRSRFIKFIFNKKL